MTPPLRLSDTTMMDRQRPPKPIRPKPIRDRHMAYIVRRDRAILRALADADRKGDQG